MNGLNIFLISRLLTRAIFLLTGIFLVGCVEHNFDDLDGHVTIDPLGIGIVEAQIKQVDGIIYIRESVEGWTKTCIAIDPTTNYSVKWLGLKQADLMRQSDYTYAEIENCK